MDFEILYDGAMSFWPGEISIEDGQFIENGVLFKNLSFVWGTVEQKTNDLDEWMSLMTWVLFAEFHSQHHCLWRYRRELGRLLLMVL